MVKKNEQIARTNKKTLIIIGLLNRNHNCLSKKVVKALGNTMKLLLLAFLTLTFPDVHSMNFQDKKILNGGAEIIYVKSSSIPISTKTKIETVIRNTENTFRFFFPNIPTKIIYQVETVDWDLTIVGGVTGMAITHNPIGEIHIRISKTYSNGIEKALTHGLPSTLIHELHHLERGWSINQNEFPQGIAIAAVNEGLAVVFAELLTGHSFEANIAPKDIDSWVHEIIGLPADANYQHWVSGKHPDGRLAIGYKAGRHIIYKALNNSSISIMQLSDLSPKEILKLAGYALSSSSENLNYWVPLF